MQERTLVHRDRRADTALSRITLADVGYVLRRYVSLIAGVVLIGLAVAAAYVVLTRPVYTARTQVLLDNLTPQALPQRPGEAATALDAAQVESQIAILRSDTLAGIVVDRLHLEKDPEFVSNAPSTLEQSKRVAVLAVQDRLEVRRQGISLVIEILFRSHDPEKAARIANVLAESYTADQIAQRANAVRQSSQWLEERIEDLRRSMNHAARSVQRFRALRDYRIVGKNEKSGDTPTSGEGGQDPTTLEELESTAATYRRIYESFLQAHTDAVQRQSYPVSNARIITPAARPLTKSHPKITLSLTMGGLVGAGIGFAIALVLHFFDRRVRSRSQVRNLLGLDCLGQLPRIGKGTPLTRKHREHWLEVNNAPYSQFSEALAHIKLRIAMGRRDTPLKTLGVVSALPGEGKSTIASNLATLYSLQGLRTLIVDVDVRNSALSRALAPKSQHGLTDALGKEAPISECVVSTGVDKLAIMPAGGGTGSMVNSPELFGSQRMHAVIQELTGRFDIVVFDMPPMELVKDGLALSPLLDGILVIAEWNETQLAVLADAVDALHEARAHLLGVVLSKVHEPLAVTYNRQTQPYVVEMKGANTMRASNRVS
jgi:polysaccharide biosynthesis transport protein